MNETFRALERLREEWLVREARRARGGIASLSGFHFQLLSTLRERVLEWCSRPAVERAVSPVIDEFLSDALAVAPDGRVVLTQAKRVLRPAGVRDALDELWRIDELAREVSPELSGRLAYRVRAAHNLVNDVSATIATWKPEGPHDDATLAAFLARTRAEVLGDPMEELLATLANQLNAPDPLELVRRWMGLLLERTSEGAAVAASRQIWSDLWRLQAAEALPPGSGITHWQDEWTSPAEIQPGGYLTGQRPTVLHLREGYFAPRPDVYDGLAARAEAWIGAAREQVGDVRLPVFWIGGRSGAGKSVALLHVLSILHEREHGPVLWLGNKTALLSAAMGRARTLRFRDSTAIIALDDPYAPEGQADAALVWREALATLEAVRQVSGASDLPLVICCGPSEQAERFREEFPDDIDVTLVEVPRETDADLVRLREWYRVRAEREPPEVGDQNVLLVQLFFEWRVQATLPEFASRLRTRIRASGRDGERVYEFLSVMLAVNRLYVGLPATTRERELTAEQQDLLDLLRGENHLAEDVRAGETGLWLAHPHLSNAIYESWFPLQKNRAKRGQHLRTGAGWSLRYGNLPPAKTGVLWAIVRGVEANEAKATDVVGRIDHEGLPRLLPRIYEDLRESVGVPLPLWLLPVWVGLRAACPAAELVPDPLVQATAELRHDNVGRVGLRLTCHMLIRCSRGLGELERRVVAAGIHRVLSGAPEWHEWLPIALDALRNGMDGGLADLAAGWAAAHPASVGNAALLLAAWSAAPHSARVAQVATGLLADAPATFGWGDVCQELLRRTPEGTVPEAVADWCERSRRELPALFLLAALLQLEYPPAAAWAREWAELWHLERSSHFVLEPLFRQAPDDPRVAAWSQRWLASGFAASGFLMEALLRAHGDDAEVRALAAEWLRVHRADLSWSFVWAEAEEAFGSPLHLQQVGVDWLTAMPHHAGWPNVWISLWEGCTKAAGAEGPPPGLQRRLVELALAWLEREHHHVLLWSVWERVAEPLDADPRLAELGPRLLRASLRHFPRWWPHLWQFAWRRSERRAELDSLARTWLHGTPGERSTWWYVFTTLWESDSGRDELVMEGVTWLRAAADDEPTWGRLWTLLWDAGHESRVDALGLRWLRVAPRHGAWGHVWRRLWDSGSSRGQLEGITTEWLEASLEWAPVQWPYVLQRAWSAAALHDSLSPLAARWLASESRDDNLWWRVFAQFRRHGGCAPLPTGELTLAWLQETSYHDPAWPRVWRWLYECGEHRDELAACALAWLRAVPEQQHWTAVLDSLWEGGAPRDELVPLAADWLGSGAGARSQRVRVSALITTPDDGSTDVPELSRWLAATGPTHPSWTFLWRTLLEHGMAVSPTLEEVLAWVRGTAVETPQWQNVWLAVWTLSQQQADLAPLALEWLRSATSFEAGYGTIAKALFAIEELRPAVIETAAQRLRALGMDPTELRAQVAEVVRARVADAPAVVPLSSLGKTLKAALPMLQETGWLGLGSVKCLVDSLGEPWLATTDSCAYRPGVHEVPVTPIGNEELRDRVVEVVREYVTASSTAVVMADAAQHAHDLLGTDLLDTSWAGYGTFKQLLLSAPDRGMLVQAIGPGYVYIPGVHARPRPGNPPAAKTRHRYEDATWESPPQLPPATYAEIFRLLADLLPTPGTDLGPLSRAISDQLKERGMPTRRSDIARIVTSVSVAGYELSAPGPHDPRAIAELTFELMLYLNRTQLPSADDGTALREQVLAAL